MNPKQASNTGIQHSGGAVWLLNTPGIIGWDKVVQKFLFLVFCVLSGACTALKLPNVLEKCGQKCLECGGQGFSDFSRGYWSKRTSLFESNREPLTSSASNRFVSGGKKMENENQGALEKHFPPISLKILIKQRKAWGRW